MDKLYSWNARRAGGRITVTHSCGKIVGVDTIQTENGRVIATDKNGRRYDLHVTPPKFNEGETIFDVDNNTYVVRDGRAVLNGGSGLGYDLREGDMWKCFSREKHSKPGSLQVV
jgi:hypothetical protein